MAWIDFVMFICLFTLLVWGLFAQEDILDWAEREKLYRGRKK